MTNNLFNAVYEALAKLDKKSKICKKYNISRNKLDWHLNLFLKETEESLELRHQMFLGAKLGDGYFQNIKNKLYKYRESHSLKELEYAKWKYLIIQSYHKNTKIIDKNNGTACEVYSSNSCSNQIKEYYDLTTDEVISKINIYGLLFYLLDDGWYSNHSKKGNFVVGSKILTIDQKKEIIKVFNKYNIQANLTGERNDISINSKYNLTLLSYLMHIAPTLDIDIIQKKFGKIIKNNICGIV